ncbi:MAG: ATP-binding protein, partial [Spirochaeta sp.]
SISPEIPKRAVADPIRLRQVIINLLSNAGKFTEEGWIEIRVSYTQLDGSRGQYTISVQDTGIGISDAQQQRLFQAFAQADSSITRRYGGTGLGLAISNHLVEKMGGRMHVESEPGRGSVFSFTVEFTHPLAVPESAGNGDRTRAELQPEAPEELARADTPAILIADDDDANRMIIAEMFQKIVPRAVIYEAHDGSEACELVEQNPVDLVIMDMMMPELDGIKAARRIREINRRTGSYVPIIALTARVHKAMRDACVAAGMDDFLSKPVGTSQVQRIVNSYLVGYSKGEVEL